MKMTQKAQRRARVKLLAKAKSEAEKDGISTRDALLKIIEKAPESENDQKLVFKTFAKVVTEKQSSALASGSEIPDY